MIPQIPLPITGNFRLLYRVPKSAIIYYLLNHAEPESLLRAFHRFVDSGSDVSQASLAAVNHYNLIRVFQSCDNFTEETASQLHEEFRYRGMKSLYLYECDGIPEPLSIDLSSMNSTIQAVQSGSPTALSFQHFSDIRIRDIESIGAPPNLFLELSYSYITPLQFVEPVTEFPNIVNDLRFGFIWIYPSQGWTEHVNTFGTNF